MKYAFKKTVSVLLSASTMLLCIPAAHLQAAQAIDGDVNADGVFNAEDVGAMQKWLVNAGKLVNPDSGNLCEDNTINVFDLCLMRRMIVEPNGFKASIKNLIWDPDTRTVTADVNYEKIPKGSGAWIGVVPSDAPYNETDADKKDIAYTYLSDFESGSFTGLKVPDGVSGSYDLRIYSNDDGGRMLACVTFNIDEPNNDDPDIGGPKAQIKNVQWDPDTRTVLADVTYENIAKGNGAWIGVVPSDTPHNETDADKTDVAYTYLSSFESGSFTGLKVPDDVSGSYDLRIYSNDDGGRELASVTFNIDKLVVIDKPVIDDELSASIKNVKWNADTRTVMADVTYENNKYGIGAWIGVVSSDTPHNEVEADKTDVAYKWLDDFESGSFPGLEIPNGLSGTYDLRVYANNDGGEELASVTFFIDGLKADITDIKWNADTRTVTADVTYQSNWYGNGAWIGVVPSDTPHNKADADSKAVAYKWLDDFESGSFPGLEIPNGLSGTYDLRVYANDNDGEELACVTFFIDGLKADIKNVQWDADTRTVTADVTYENNWYANGAHISVVPSDTPHNQVDADVTEVTYKWLDDFESGSFPGLTVPDNLSGSYDLRVYANNDGGEELACVTFTIE